MILSSYYWGYLLPDFGFSMTNVKAYWGKHVAFALGFDIFRVQYSWLGRGEPFSTSELFILETGASWMLKRANQVKSKLPLEAVGKKSFVPRLDVLCGFSPFNPDRLSDLGSAFIFSPTVRLQTRFYITRTIQVLLEDRYIWAFDYDGWQTPNLINLSCCFSLGKDFSPSEEAR